MYRCQLCNSASEPGETQFKVITKKRRKEKGWEIDEEKICCHRCWMINVRRR